MGAFKIFQTDEERKRDKERKRFYLLPGMGGRAYRRKVRRILGWSLFVGLLASGLMALGLYLLNR